MMPVLPAWQWLIFKRSIGRKNRFKPFSRAFGNDRGRPIDRYYIERFLASEAAVIRGRVLETGDNHYTRMLGGERVTWSDILSPQPDNQHATITADLTNAPHIPDDSFDCIILTQTLQYIYDHQAAIRTSWRILKPGGALLASVPSVTPMSMVDKALWGEYWRYTSQGALRLFEEVFGSERVEVRAYGNLVVVTAFLQGFAVEDLSSEDFSYNDPHIELIVTVKATKPARRH